MQPQCECWHTEPIQVQIKPQKNPLQMDCNWPNVAVSQCSTSLLALLVCIIDRLCSYLATEMYFLKLLFDLEVQQVSCIFPHNDVLCCTNETVEIHFVRNGIDSRYLMFKKMF